MCPGLENILLAVVSEAHEDQRCMISFISGIFIILMLILETDNRMGE